MERIGKLKAPLKTTVRKRARTTIGLGFGKRHTFCALNSDGKAGLSRVRQSVTPAPCHWCSVRSGRRAITSSFRNHLTKQSESELSLCFHLFDHQFNPMRRGFSQTLREPDNFSTFVSSPPIGESRRSSPSFPAIWKVELRSVRCAYRIYRMAEMPFDILSRTYTDMQRSSARLHRA
jgi:hypothetical protein